MSAGEKRACSVELVKKYFEMTDDILMNKISRRKARAGQRSGSINPDGYVQVRFFHQDYKGHRLAWVLYYGEWPADDMEIDHRNGDRANNSKSNLRAVPGAGNCQNSAIRKDNVSGYTGVAWIDYLGRWRAYINVNGRRRYLGYFNDPEKANEAYLAAKAELHEYQPRHRERR